MTDTTDAPEVRISGAAHKTLTTKFRQWSGWRDATLHFGEPESESPFAHTDFENHSITADPDILLLNPNRVLNTVTQFRLRQEAVLTGVLLHEAAHVRYSKWLPRSAEDVETFCHGDGTEPSKATVALATLLEEPRIEGHMALDISQNLVPGATGLGWTMRAATLRLLPMSHISTDPDQAVMDVLSSWVLRAGRAHAASMGDPVPTWVVHFDNLLYSVLNNHLGNPSDSHTVFSTLKSMLTCVDHSGSTMLDTARDVLALLFPETDPEDQPQAGGSSCSAGEGASEGSGASASTEQGEEGENGDESDEQDSGGGEDQSDADEPGDGDEGSESGAGEGAGEGPSEAEQAAAELAAEAMAEALASMEADATEATKAEAKAEMTATDNTDDTDQTTRRRGGVMPGMGQGRPNSRSDLRSPGPDDRDVAMAASMMLRDLLDPTETSRVMLTDTPSAQVDGGALAAWKADGGKRDPHFFRRTQRSVTPAPPVEIAILVDVSGSMDEMQEPSAVLSWALASAAMDLANFAGRGQQVKCTMIHWGHHAEVVQPVGERPEFIREAPCDQGTTVMGAALGLVEQQMPGFFDPSPEPVNRLIVQFTDWYMGGITEASHYLLRAAQVGATMVSIVPGQHRTEHSALNAIGPVMEQLGARVLTEFYNPKAGPASVWSAVSEGLKA